MKTTMKVFALERRSTRLPSTNGTVGPIALVVVEVRSLPEVEEDGGATSATAGLAAGAAGAGAGADACLTNAASTFVMDESDNDEVSCVTGFSTTGAASANAVT